MLHPFERSVVTQFLMLTLPRAARSAGY